MDPHKAECHGHFLYGSGFFYEQDQRLAELTGETQSFCNITCPRTQTCWDAHRKRVQEEHGDEVEAHEKLEAEAERRGIGKALLAHRLMQDGRPPPYQKYALPNFRLGRLHGTAAAKAGTKDA